MTQQTAGALPAVVDQQTWQAALDDLRTRESRHRELDAIAAQRRRLPMVELPGLHADRPGRPRPADRRLQRRSQLIVYNHMWSDGADGGAAAARA